APGRGAWYGAHGGFLFRGPAAHRHWGRPTVVMVVSDTAVSQPPENRPPAGNCPRGRLAFTGPFVAVAAGCPPRRYGPSRRRLVRLVAGEGLGHPFQEAADPGVGRRVFLGQFLPRRRRHRGKKELAERTRRRVVRRGGGAGWGPVLSLDAVHVGSRCARRFPGLGASQPRDEIGNQLQMVTEGFCYPSVTPGFQGVSRVGWRRFSPRRRPGSAALQTP